MIIWSGRGILIVLVFFVTGMIFAPIVPKEFCGYVFAFASFVTATFSWFLGNAWNNEDGRIVIDERTGQKLLIKRNHSLFFIKMQYWGIIFSVIGIIILFNMSIIVTIIALVCLIIIGFLIYRNKIMINNSATQEARIESQNTKKQKNPELLIDKDIESEAERLKRRQEKEDPSRFMPK